MPTSKGIRVFLMVVSLFAWGLFPSPLKAQSLQDREYGKFDTNGNVKVVDAGENYTPMKKNANVGIVTDSIVWDPATGKKTVITDIVISTNAVNNVTVKHGATTALGPLYFAANGGLFGDLETPIKGAVDENITITTTAGNTSITLTGYEE